MFDHISIGVKDVERSKAFYDAVLAPLGHRCLSADEGALGYGADRVSFWVLASTAPVPPDDASGLHLCFAAPTRRSVDAFHAAALGAGGLDNGQPGTRADYGPTYYAAFVKDPDGYRIEAYCGTSA
ncbi:VOC family protein [Xanthobacter autotrophicus DSM 431]|uniref:VOC family protein n=1 Tax=Xanthobacter nonsaccharivorans TaxID=3119912 RepID=UPI003726923F